MFFGMRNLPDVNKAIQSIYEILKPEGLFLVVDIVKNYEKDTINTYFEHFVPKIGSFFSKDKEAYKYLAQSRETYPSHDGLMRILQKNKFRIIRRKRYLNGIISLNLAKKYE
jgi:ubiquinone/menaquinone biosynthesis C-methylase UbiE